MRPEDSGEQVQSEEQHNFNEEFPTKLRSIFAEPDSSSVSSEDISNSTTRKNKS
jgi:hypothetical protein